MIFTYRVAIMVEDVRLVIISSKVVKEVFYVVIEEIFYVIFEVFFEMRSKCTLYPKVLYTSYVNITLPYVVYVGT